jgi:hypothetical protein
MQLEQDILKMIKEIANENKHYDFIPHPLLRGQQIILSIGSKRYYSPDIHTGDVTNYTIPETDILNAYSPFECVIDYIKSID